MRTYRLIRAITAHSCHVRAWHEWRKGRTDAGWVKARAEAKAKWDAMTPEEKQTVKKAAAKKRLSEVTALEAVAAKTSVTVASVC